MEALREVPIRPRTSTRDRHVASKCTAATKLQLHFTSKLCFYILSLCTARGPTECTASMRRYTSTRVHVAGSPRPAAVQHHHSPRVLVRCIRPTARSVAPSPYKTSPSDAFDPRPSPSLNSHFLLLPPPSSFSQFGVPLRPPPVNAFCGGGVVVVVIVFVFVYVVVVVLPSRRCSAQSPRSPFLSVTPLS